MSHFVLFKFVRGRSVIVYVPDLFFARLVVMLPVGWLFRVCVPCVCQHVNVKELTRG